MDRLNPMAYSGSQPYADCEPLNAELPELRADAERDRPSPQQRLALIVRTIEADILPRLVRAHRLPTPAESAPAPQPLGEADVLCFVQLVLADDDAAWQAAIDAHLRRGVHVEDIYLGLLGPAANELGRMWEEDTATFGEVTVGVGRLQRIMRSLSPAFGTEVDHPPDGRRVLLIPAPGEQHTFGLAIVAEFFRRGGWEVVGDADVRAADPAALVRREWFDVIGISVGSEARLDWLKSGIAAVRHASRNRAIGVMVGGPTFSAHPGRAREVGADATSADGRQAPVVAEQLLGERVKRL
jgi:MerR family transcriptional regulator, light-induced transcriptional regulator